MSWIRPRAATLLLFSLTVACSPAEVTPSSTSVPAATSSTAEPTTTTTAATTTSATEQQGDTVTVLLHPTGEMGPGWTELSFPYGESEDTLGTSPGGENLMFGPEYGAQVPDGSWWFLDAAKMRYAHYSPEGEYIDQAIFPTEILSQGIYFQFQMPQALDDGSVVASGFRGEASSELLTFADGTFTAKTIDASVAWSVTDGELLYGFSAADNSPHSLDPAADTPDDVEWFLARDGSRYMITLESGELTVELPDAGVTKILRLRFSEDPDVKTMGSVEVETTQDGSIHLLFYGVPASDETLEVGGLVSVSPDGRVGESEPIVSPFSASDTGSPAHLGVHPGTSTVWIMVVGVDGVHVYGKAG